MMESISLDEADQPMERDEQMQSGNVNPDLAVDLDCHPRALAGPHPLAMVYGGGGVFGIGYGAGIAHGLAAAGINVAEAPALGTSAGAWVASAVALGLTYDDLADIEVPSVPSRQRGALGAAARSVFGEARHPLVAVSAVRLGGRRRRHILDGARYPLADLAAASSSVPGLFPPHPIDGRSYVDGGMWSVTSVDAAEDADQVIVVAPLAGSVLPPMGRSAELLLTRELRTWRVRHPEKMIMMIRPNKEIARLAGRNPMALFDAERARLVYPLAVEQGLRWGKRILLRQAAMA